MSRVNNIPGITPTSSLPEYPPISPPAEDLSPQIEEFITPGNSPSKSDIVSSSEIGFGADYLIESLQPQPLFLPTPQLADRSPLGSRLLEYSERWDHTINTPSYHKSNLEFWLSRQGPIPIRSTVSSPLSNLNTPPIYGFGDSGIVDNTVVPCSANSDSSVFQFNMQEPADPNAASEAKRLYALKQKVDYKMGRIKIDRIVVSNIPAFKEKLDDILELSEEFGIGMTALLANYPQLEESFRAQYDADLNSLNIKVDELEDKIYSKIHQLQTPSEPSPAQPQYEICTLPTSSAVPNLAASKTAIVAKAVVKYNTLLESALTATQDIEEDGLYLETASNERIQRLVMKISKYEKIRDKIKAGHTEYLEFTAVHQPDPSSYDPVKLKDAVEDAIKSINNLIISLEHEDDERELCTLVPKKSEKVKWPNFSGKPGESFFKFKEQFLKAARQNQTNKEDQFTKLRENLKDFPLTLIPENMNDVDKAFQRLNDTFGDPQKLVNFELKKLEKIDLFPNSDDGSYSMGTRAQAEWLLSIETVLAELIKMASADDADRDIKRSVYGPQTTSVLLNKFPLVLKQKLISAAKNEPLKEKLDVFIYKLKEWSSEALEMEKYHTEVKTSSKKQQQLPQSLKDQQVQLFNPPKLLPTCKVCSEVNKKNGSSPSVLHLSAHVTGCPKFIEINIHTRTTLCNTLNLCKMCLRDDSPGHEKQCIVLKLKNKNKGKTKYEFTCRESFCNRHMWLCTKHKSQNSKSMESKGEQLQRDHGLNLVHLLGLNHLKQPQPPESKKHSDIPKHAVRPLSCNKTLRQHEKKLRKKVRKAADFPIEVVPVPEGESLFMFQALKGNTKPVFAFYDSGCSNACLRSGIPGVELPGQVMSRGPFTVEGVNGVIIEAGDEWLVHLERVDGRKQALRGLTLTQITGNSPQFNIERAAAAIKADKPDDMILQQCSVPSVVGGSVDVLIGIQYNSIFPQPIHRLPNGLEIYRCILTSHDSSINATIAGPHSSFEILADHHGGAASVLALFLDGLEKFKKWGPPSLKTSPMCVEEIEFAKSMNSYDSGHVYEDIIQVEKAEEFLDDAWNDEETTPDALQIDLAATFSLNASQVVFVCDCQQFCPSLNAHSVLVNPSNRIVAPVNFADIEKISPLCKLKLLEDGGLNIEYRCVKCCDCPNCKNSDESEKTSLREEAEEQMIKDSVKLDIENQRIICSLPLRGPENEFLTTNRDKAHKILDQQCRKYFNDIEVKDVALKAFDKLLDNGHASFIEDLCEDDLLQFMDKDPQYFIPWRLVFKDSVSTPCRAVLDASSRTSYRSNGTAGRCLNDLVVKGKVTTINLVKMLLRFTVGAFAINGDLKQFYNSCKLIPSQWNLQRFLYRENMDPNNPIKEGVIKTLIYGVKSVSRQSEYALSLLADYVRNVYPEVSKLLEESRYVDDEGESKSSKVECFDLIDKADKTFSLVNLEVKEWAVSGETPSEKISKDGASVDVGGMRWFCSLDTLEVKIPPLHFGKKRRGRLGDKVEIFGNFGTTLSETLKNLDEFVPNKLTRRLVASKKASIFDILGKLAPILIKSSELLRLTIKNTSDWDTAMSPELRNQWLKEFLLWEQLRGINFNRAIMPYNAVDSKLRVIVSVDAANPAMTIGAWGGFKCSDDLYSCQLMIGRALLTPEDTTIPKSELTAFMGGSNLLWLLKKSLNDWIDNYILIGDSKITLCWVSSENKKLSLFVRNRVIQVRRATELENMYHVVSDKNPADIGTRPNRVTVDDVQVGSKWISGVEWMRQEIDEAVRNSILTPVSDLRLNTSEEMDKFHDGCVFDQVPEILTRGHVLNQARISKIQERASFSKYLLVPTVYNFRKTVRIYSYAFSFIHKLKVAVQRRKGTVDAQPLLEGTVKFSLFTISCSSNPSEPQSKVYSYFAEFTADQAPPGSFALSQTEKNASAAVSGLTDKYINMALTYLFRKASSEVKHFNSDKSIQKIAVEQDSILFSKNRILDTMNFTEIGELGLSDLPVMGLKSHVPIIDRHSPLAYSIGQHIHWNVSHHRGIETCNRFSLQNCLIMQGMSLYKELSDDCLWCAKKRKKYLEASMGPISDNQLLIAPPFWCCQVDLFGPLFCYVPGQERALRGKAAAPVKTWILTIVCEVTKLVNCQVIEKSDASGILDGLTRLGCEVGLPSLMLADQGSNLVKAIRDAEATLKNLKLQVYKEKGIKFEVCSVGGHNEHGLVERIIRSIQDSMLECGLHSKKLTATGLQTLAKLVENDYNNLPAGFKYDRDQDNTEILKILTPNMMRMGRINTRALSGPLKLPSGMSDMVERVAQVYKAWYKIWSEAYVPKLLFRPKWFKDDVDVKVGDIVYFCKSDSDVGSPWMLGVVSAVERSRDGIIRKLDIKYRNASETQDRTTQRNIRTVCKIWSVDDWNLQDDLAELVSRLRKLDDGNQLVRQMQNVVQARRVATVADLRERVVFCCASHSTSLGHTYSGKVKSYSVLEKLDSSTFAMEEKVPFFALSPHEEFMSTDKDNGFHDSFSDFLLGFENVREKIGNS